MQKVIYKSEVVGKNGIVARVIADSVSPVFGRITTFEVEHHRWILAEINKHRMLSNNYQSSRAVPVSKIIDQVVSNPATPVFWGKNQTGMQASEQCDNDIDLPMFTSKESWVDTLPIEAAWETTAEIFAEYAECFNSAGYHKQIVNRLLEPFMMVKGVITATEWDNFFFLRRHKDAQPELQELANCMFEAMKQSSPDRLDIGFWHLPYVRCERDFNSKQIYTTSLDEVIKDEDLLTLEQAKKVSAVACAQVSFRNLDLSPETVERVYSRLVDGEQPHAVCLEHQATPMVEPVDTMKFKKDWEHGVSHVDKNGYFWSGNFKWFIQNRKQLPNECCTDYKRWA